jgi:tetratricopeptide (TPR) repeat protein
MDMERSVEDKIRDALKQIDDFRTPDCLDTVTLGRFAEKTLDEKEMVEAEAHLHACLYCLKRLNDMAEMLHYQKQKVPLPRMLAEQLRKLKPGGEIQQEKCTVNFLEKLKAFFTFTPRQWQISAITLASAWMVFLVSILVTRYVGNHADIPALNTDAFVKVQALNDAGNILREEQGVVIGPDGLIASNLLPLAGACKLQITLKDGRTIQTARIWKDDDKNLAVMKFDTSDLPVIPTADIEQISLGQRIFAVSDLSKRKKDFQEAIVSDFKEISGRRKNGSVKYLQIATQTATTTRGALVDDRGRLLGFLITQEKHLNIAAPAADLGNLVKQGKAIPLRDLKNVPFSAAALNTYMKGILARDALRWDEAQKYFEKAVRLNPRLTGARLELGDIYYRKHQFDKEQKEYEEVLKIEPDNSEALYDLAWNLESHGKYREAAMIYENSLALDPEDTDTLYQLGLSYLVLGEKEKALAIYSRLNKLEPGKAEMLRKLAR